MAVKARVIAYGHNNSFSEPIADADCGDEKAMWSIVPRRRCRLKTGTVTGFETPPELAGVSA